MDKVLAPRTVREADVASKSHILKECVDVAFTPTEQAQKLAVVTSHFLQECVDLVRTTTRTGATTISLIEAQVPVGASKSSLVIFLDAEVVRGLVPTITWGDRGLQHLVADTTCVVVNPKGGNRDRSHWDHGYHPRHGEFHEKHSQLMTTGNGRNCSSLPRLFCLMDCFVHNGASLQGGKHLGEII